MTNLTDPVPTTPAPFAADDPRAVLGRAVALASAVIDAVRPDQLDLPTPCTDMDVRTLVGHLVTVLERVAAAGRDEDPTTWPGELTGLADDEWSSAWRAAAHDVQSAWSDDALLARPTRLPWTTVSGDETLRIWTNEVTVHTWDLARATGQQPNWDVVVVDVSFDCIRVVMPAQGRMEMYEQVKTELPPEVEWQDPFGPAVVVPDDAPLIDRLVAWNGRDPS